MTKISARVAVLAFPVLLTALAGCEDPTKDMPKATVSSAAPAKAPAPPMGTTTAAAPMPAAAAGMETLALDSTSTTVGFVGSKVTGKHEGKFTTVSGSIALAGGKAEGGKIRVEIDLASVKTDQEKLDGHLKTKDFFDVEKFPKAIFTSSEIKAGGEKGATDTITGELDLHGVKKTITFPATITVTPDGATGTAEFSINRKDFGLVYPGKPDDLIRDDVGLKLALKATRKK
jgi:polyisoprenoid-binding protein YceI